MATAHDTRRKNAKRELGLERTPAELKSMFVTAAGALLQNRPLRGWSRTSGASNVLSRSEMEALSAVGLTTEHWSDDVDGDPITQSVADYMALLETSLTAAAAAKMLRVDVSRVRQRLRESSLYGIEYDGEWRLPRFQFVGRRVIPGLAQVLAALPEDLNPLEVAEWFLAPNPDLEARTGDEPHSPRNWLVHGLAPERPAELASDL
jgi:hypothetical protein